MTKILAIASGGGHWEQLMLIKDGFSASELVYANTITGLAEKSGVSPCYIVRDCNRDHLWDNVVSARDVWRILRTEKPDIIISTGAAPGLIALFLGKLTGRKTIWIDSVANSEKLSLSGRLAGYFVDLWLTQWEHLSSDRGPRYWGSVL